MDGACPPCIALNLCQMVMHKISLRRKNINTHMLLIRGDVCCPCNGTEMCFVMCSAACACARCAATWPEKEVHYASQNQQF